MSEVRSAIYEGEVVHKRLTPRRHAFSYRVFSFCLDVDEIDALDASLSHFSRNQFNLVSFWDADVGEPGPEPVAVKARRLLARSGLSGYGARIQLVCYPRLLGYVFNPLSVYFCREADGTLGAVIYEVTNTFKERKAYVIRPGNGAQGCRKEMYVSPFTARAGSYGFHTLPPDDRVILGVNFREDGRPVLRTHFRGDRRPLDDQTIRRLMITHPLMTAKVIGAIHYEAARLWWKGVPLVARHSSPAYSFTLADEPTHDARPA